MPSPISAAAASQPHLVRQLGLWSSVGVVIGITIGSGIFRTPAGIAARVPDPQLMLFAWMLGGVITLCGALSIAELAAALPHTGGLYVYLREGWGRMTAFLFGWAQLVLVRAAAVGSIATVFGEYLLRSIGIDPIVHEQAADYVAIGAITFATVINIRGALWGAAIVGMSTIMKYGALVLLVVASFLFGGAHGASASNLVAPGGPVQAGLFGLAIVSVLWAYDGFADLAFAGGEVASPQRNLPRALIIGTLAIIAIYVLANAAYLYVIPIDAMPASRLVAADTLNVLFGRVGVSVVSVVVMISTFGSLNGTMLVNPRIFFAMAEDRLFFPALARVHPRYKTPHVAIALAGLLGIGLVLAGTFEQLIDAFVKAMLPFYALSVAAIFTLRRNRPDLRRPYTVIAYPLVPIVYLLGVIYLMANALLTDTFWTVVVFGVVLAGIPVYYAAFGRRSSA
ncbi:MAG: amino acid permease [Acidobacteria bacterium]|nr:amino acid permease [Acidobacteriota bacterium]